MTQNNLSYNKIRGSRKQFDKKNIIHKLYKSNTIEHELESKNTDWKKTIIESINDLNIPPYLKTKIKKDLRKNFFGFVRYNTYKEHITYEDWLLKRNKKLEYVPSTDMCQNMKIHTKDIDNNVIKETITKSKKSHKKPTTKAIGYDVVGSGLTGQYCITGEKEIHSSLPIQYYNDVPKQKRFWTFKIKIDYYTKEN